MEARTSALTRRRFIQWLPLASATELAAPPALAQYPHLDEQEQRARDLGYAEDATTVDHKRYPKYAVGETCAGCDLYLAKPTEPWAACTLFPRRLVAGKGWCDAYRPRAR